MKPKRNQSIGNISSDSGVLEMDNRSSGHSRSASNATSCYSNDTGFNDNINNALPNLPNVCRINTKALIILISFISAFLCFLCYVHLPFFLTKILQTIINVKPGGEFYNFWLESSEPTEVGLYFFHIENPWEVENGINKLKIKEIGPYYFKQRFLREIHSFSADQSIVNFTERRFFYFDDEKTKLSLNDNITVVNVPLAALSSVVPKFMEEVPDFNILSYFSYSLVNDILAGQRLFINITVRELLFGYKLDILDRIKPYEDTFASLGIELIPRELFPNNSFGILNGRNGTPDGPYEMFTGLSNTQHKFGYIKSWKNKTKLECWKHNTCNAINGTDGTIWPAGINQNDRLDFFIPDICRSLYVTFQEKSSYKGISTYLFSAPDNVLAGKRTNPDNECFCMEDEDELAESRCLDGIFDLSGCQNDVPVIVSLPHFLGADKRITEKIIGLKPNPEKHRPLLNIEPNLGLVIHGDSRLQMSIRVVPNDNIIGVNKMNEEIIIPIFWGYKKLGMSDEMATTLQYKLYIPLAIIKILLIIFIICLLSLGTYGYFKWILFNKKIINFFHIFKKDNDLEKFTKYSNGKQYKEMERMIPRIESETSDLCDSKSENNSLENSPKASTIELKRLVDATETCI